MKSQNTIRDYGKGLANELGRERFLGGIISLFFYWREVPGRGLGDG